jgi:hypothetical protein
MFIEHENISPINSGAVLCPQRSSVPINNQPPLSPTHPLQALRVHKYFLTLNLPVIRGSLTIYIKEIILFGSWLLSLSIVHSRGIQFIA